MLLDMLTTGAAAKHGHECSPPRRLPSPANTKNGAYSLAQMPLSILGSVLRYQTPSPATSTQHGDNTETPTKHVTNAASPMLSPYSPPTNIDSHAPSRPGSSGSSAVADEKPKKKTPRPKTSFIIAHPPPTVHPRSKLHIRPKVQLQLHQILSSQRPKPVYEVIPFSLLAPRSTRRLTRTFNTRERLGHSDLLVVKAAAYGQTDEEHKSDDERWGSREVIAVICPGKTERGQVVSNTEICMDDGTSRWEVTSMPNGGYEFNSLDEHGLAMKARWVVKPPNSRRISGLSVNSQFSPGLPPSKDDAKWNFSAISANSRRHPVIASMTRTRIDVNDSYTMPAATQPSTPSVQVPTSPALTPASIDATSFLDAIDRSPIKTEEALRRFIVVSGIWVSSLHESYEHASSPLCPSFNTSGNIRPPVCRTVSMSFLDSPRSASPASIDENEKSIPKLLRNTSQRLSRNASFIEPPSSPMSAKIAPSSPTIKTRSRRANSTGTHNLYSLTGSLKKRYGIPSQVETLSETEEDKENKRSEEISRLKQLAFPTPIEASPAEIPAVEAPPRLPVLIIPTTTVIRPSTDGPASPILLPSPQLPESDRTRKTQSAFNPIITAGMWDSGVTDGPGLKRRPTSMFVMNERKRKEEKKRGRSEGRSKKQERETLDFSTSKEDLKKGNKEDCTGMGRKFKNSLKSMFGRKGKT
ncbi:hypothetical protein BU25DRAFT_30395 [Macroventuria anomochaeta]|uniref:Uncharacterized protein n=1 Tax=Macroventuria anomochaeta TaxID=301207 RepID=A0ACB6S4Y3_9PLEO|nr:uncharacterized protein BU25DRAFT_30395 [Macroventuria anomochaeta]KAF2628690.1 hypothetical protein BU25DRAFT_30395 [Macroventuria anomochaeta]